VASATTNLRARLGMTAASIRNNPAAMPQPTAPAAAVASAPGRPLRDRP
jgi:hypothetical protein